MDVARERDERGAGIPGLQGGGKDCLAVHAVPKSKPRARALHRGSVSMKRPDAVPEPISIDEWSKHHTLELCGDEEQGLRCMLEKGHAGMHECLANSGVARWLSQHAS